MTVKELKDWLGSLDESWDENDVLLKSADGDWGDISRVATDFDSQTVDLESA